MTSLPLLEAFAKKHNKKWKNIESSIKRTEVNIDKIASAFSAKKIPPVISTDADMVIFGSMARNECTEGSDVDWTLLVDGQVADEFEFSKIIKQILIEIKMQQPGKSGMFGQITFSHDLVHYIGGEGDTNHNISRRILLLLESEKMLINKDSKTTGAFERVIKAIINQYVEHDSGLSSDNKENARVPRFLLNDIIRFWRTMCVDFAYKQKEEEGYKWGLRNIKLRLSRKLIYIKGILMCYSCFINEGLDNVAQHLVSLSREKPLEIILKVLENRVHDELLIKLFDKYDEFLGQLNDSEIRTNLENLKMGDAYDDDTFLKSRITANEFQNVIMEIFEKDEKLQEFTKKYLIF